MGQVWQVPTVVAFMAVEYVFPPHSRHAALPMTFLYLPAAHALHVPPLGPVYPGLHTQLVRAVDPTGACVLMEQV